VDAALLRLCFVADWLLLWTLLWMPLCCGFALLLIDCCFGCCVGCRFALVSVPLSLFPSTYASMDTILCTLRLPVVARCAEYCTLFSRGYMTPSGPPGRLEYIHTYINFLPTSYIAPTSDGMPRHTLRVAPSCFGNLLIAVTSNFK